MRLKIFLLLSLLIGTMGETMSQTQLNSFEWNQFVKKFGGFLRDQGTFTIAKGGAIDPRSGDQDYYAVYVLLSPTNTDNGIVHKPKSVIISGITDDITGQNGPKYYTVPSRLLIYGYEDYGEIPVIGLGTLDENLDYGGVLGNAVSNIKCVTIPSTVKVIGPNTFCSNKVTEEIILSGEIGLADYAFYHCKKLVSLKGADLKITSIGNNTFEGCPELKSFGTPTGLTKIGNSAFKDCTGLTSVEFPPTLKTLGNSPFNGCSALTRLYMKDCQVKSIDNTLLDGCKNLTSLILPDSLTSIGYNALEGCSKLTSLELPSGITHIGSSAFSGCSGLASLKLPASLESIGKAPFDGCSSLDTLDMKDFQIKSIDNTLLDGCKGLTTLVLPDSLTSIGDYALGGCAKLASLELPSSVTSIGNSAFSGCSGLTLLELPAGLTSIGQSAFSGCSGLTTLELPSSLTSIGNDALNGCSKLSTLELPAGLTSIGNSAFSGCSGLTSLELPAGLTSIGNSALSGCSGLTSLELPAGVNSIGSSAFRGCSGLTSLKLPAALESIGASLFSGCSSLDTLDMKDCQITSIDKNLLDGYKGLTTLELPSCLTSIGNDALKGCSKLATLELPASLASIGSSALSGCSGLKQISCLIANPLGNSGVDSDSKRQIRLVVPTLSYSKYANSAEWGAFDIAIDNPLACEITLTQPGTLAKNIKVKDLENYTSLKITGSMDSRDVVVMNRMPNLQSLDLSGANVVASTQVYYSDPNTLEKYCTEDSVMGGCFLNAIAPKHLKLPGVKEVRKLKGSNLVLQSLLVPGSVNTIDETTFQNMPLTRLEFEASDVMLAPKTNTFKGCAIDTLVANRAIYCFDQFGFGQNNVKEAYFGATVYPRALDGSETLTKVTVSGDIGDYAFRNCKALINVTLKDSVNSIGQEAFGGCARLSSIELPTSVQTIPPGAFSQCVSLTSVTHAGGLLEIKNDAFHGCRNLTDFSLPSSVKTISSGAFKDCRALENVSLPSSLNTLGSEAFNSCVALKSVTVNEGLTEIGSSAFAGCNSLSSLKLSSTVTKIGDKAFENCPLPVIDLPQRLDSVGASAFNGHRSPSLIIPDGIKYIGASAFMGRNLQKMNKLQIPCHILTPGFMKDIIGQFSMDEVIINGPGEVPDGALRTVSTASLRVEEGITKIGNDNCTLGEGGYNVIYLPSTITSLGENVFSTKENLRSRFGTLFVYAATPPQVQATSFTENDYKYAKVYVPEDSYFDYWVHDIWGKFNGLEGTNFTVDSITMDCGKEMKLITGNKVTIRVSQYPNLLKTASLSSSNPDVVSVDQDGNVLAVSAGQAVITAKCDEATASVTVTVEDPVLAEKLKLQYEAMSLFAGQTQALGTEVEPDNHTFDVTYEISDPNVVSIDKLGNLTALNPGNALVIASIDGLTDTCRFCVPNASLTPARIPTEARYFSYTSNGSYITITGYKEDLPKVVNIPALIDGLPVECISESAFADCNAVVIYVSGCIKTMGANSFINNHSLESITFDEGIKRLGPQGSLAFDYSLKTVNFPSTMEYIDKLTFYCDNDLTITCLATTPPECASDCNMKGTAYVPGEAVNAYKNAPIWKNMAIRAIVPTAPLYSLSVSGIGLPQANFLVAENGAPFSIAYDVFELAGRDIPEFDVTWVSSNEEVATVDNDGLVTPLKSGYVEITATLSESQASAARRAPGVSIDNDGLITITAGVTVSDKISSMTEVEMEDAPTAVYNMSGIKVGTELHNLAPGVYIVVKGTRSYKVVVR